MSEEESKSLYEKHKKYHDSFKEMKNMFDDTHIREFKAILHDEAYKLFNEKQKDGVLDLSKLSDEELKKETDKIFDSAQNFILTKYYNMSEEQIESLKDIKNLNGSSALEKLVAEALGGIDKNVFYDQIKGKGIVQADSLYQDLANVLSGQHLQARLRDYTQKKFDTIEDMKGIESYTKMAKEHNPKGLERYRHNDFKSIQEAQSAMQTMAQYLQEQYHPDKEDTYN